MPTLASEAFGGLTGRLAWLALLHSLWIGLLVASGVALWLQAAMRRSHRTRHAVLIVAMLAVALGPVAFAIAQHVIGSRADRDAAPTRAAILVSRTGASRIPSWEPSDRSRGHAAPDSSRTAPRVALASGFVARVAIGIRAARPVAIAAWLATVATMGSVLVVGGLGLRRFCRQADPASPPLQDRFRRLARLLRLRRIPTVLVHAGQAEPFLCGVLRPAVVLPRAWISGASPRCLDAILAHELAHARRLDHLVNLGQRLVEVGLCFHPAVHWLSRSLRRERELCADALAVRLTGDPLALAEALQSVARLRLTSPRMAAVGASPGGPSVSLLPRIQELLGMTPSRPGRSVWPFAALPAAGFLAMVAAASGIADARLSPSDTPLQAVAGNGARSAERPASSEAVPKGVVADPGKPTSYNPPGIPAGDQNAADDDRQICYQVRFINGDLASLRRLLNRFKLLKQEADIAAWTLDDASLRDLLAQVQADAGMSIIEAPKVTSFHRAHAIVTNCEKQRYVAGYDGVEDRARPFRPIVKELDLGSKVDITGQIRGEHVADGTRVSLDVSDSRLLGFRTERCEQRVGPEVIAADYHVSEMLDRRCQVTCDVPDGTHVLISLGRSPLPRHPTTGAAGLANGLFAAMGLPQPVGFVRIERLVLVTPRRIILESEEVSGPLSSALLEGASQPR